MARWCAGSTHGLLSSPRWLKWLCFAGLLSNIPMSLYLSLWHQRAPLSVTQYIHEVSDSSHAMFPSCSHMLLSQHASVGDSVHFLMPCHSTPFYSHLHKNVSLYTLNCDPEYDERSHPVRVRV